MNPNVFSQQPHQQQFPNNGINPAMLSNFRNQQASPGPGKFPFSGGGAGAGGVNPMQLMSANMGSGGMGNLGGMPGAGAGGGPGGMGMSMPNLISANHMPTQQSQQHQQQQQQQQLMNMGMNNGINLNPGLAMGMGNVNPAQLMNGMNIGSMGMANFDMTAMNLAGGPNSIGINPSALSNGNMNSLSNALQSHQQQSSSLNHLQSSPYGQSFSNQLSNPNSHNIPRSNPIPNAGNPMANLHAQSQQNQGNDMNPGNMSQGLINAGNFSQMLNVVGLSREQFAALSPQERQIAGNKMVQAAAHQQQRGQQQLHQQQHHQQQQQHQQPQHMNRPPSNPRGPSFDPRPSSAASAHSQSHSQSHHGMNLTMPGQQPSRPGTSHSNASGHMSMSARPQSPMHHPQLQQHSQGMNAQRPPSAMGSRDFMQQSMMDGSGMGIGFPDKPPTPSNSAGRNGHPGGNFHGGPPQMMPNGFPGAGGSGQMPGANVYPPHGSPDPMGMGAPGSPYRGAKRKLAAGPPMMGHGMPGSGSGGSMGPPMLNRQMSGSSSTSGVGLDQNLTGMGMGGLGMMPNSMGIGGGGGGNPMVNGMGPGGAPTPGPNIRRQPSASIDLGMGQPGGMGGMMSPEVSRMAPASNPMMMHGMTNGMGVNMNPGIIGGGMGESPIKPPFMGGPPRPQQSPSKAPMELSAVGKIGMPGGDRSSLPPPSASIPTSTPIPPPSLPTSGGPNGAASTTLSLPNIPNVTLDRETTHVSNVAELPVLTEDEIVEVKRWQSKDKEYMGTLNKMKDRMKTEVAECFGKRMWWERGANTPLTARRENFDVRYPHTRRREHERKGAPKRREGLKIPRKLHPRDANKPELLVPIRLEFDADHYKMRDTFVWNLNDPVVTPHHFAQSLIEDYALPSSYHGTIVKSIEDQLSDYKAHSLAYDADTGEQLAPDEPAPVITGSLEDKDAEWWEQWRKKLMTDYVLGRRKRAAAKNSKAQSRKKRKRAAVDTTDATLDDDTLDEGGKATATAEEEEESEVPLRADDLELDESQMVEDLRILIKLDIMVGQMKLDDQFEWDLDNASPSPEQFADVYVKELGLSGEFKTAIAHSIREQVQTYQKSLFLVGHPSDGTAVQDDELRMSFLPSVTSAARAMDQVQSYTPLLNRLSDGEIDRTEKERDKDMSRRRKRNTRGRRGVALPDREPVRTYRTPAIGFPELSQSAMALAVAANAPTSRRAAAAAASLTIANMVANENGERFMPTPAPQVAQPAITASKEKKFAGFFKSPDYPSSVLLPRAFVTAPTKSTATGPLNLPPQDSDPIASTSATAPDSKTSKVVTAKRQKEMEREAKEKEFADTQHTNIIDGVWHCSNCGCPESIAVGRRKGPLGDKTQCGACGKFWHRHRRPRPVEYNSDLQHHSNLQRDAELSKSSAKKRKVQSTNGPRDDDDPPTPIIAKAEIVQPPVEEEDRAPSPVSTTSSASEPPLAQKVKMNGTATAPPTPAPPVTRSASAQSASASNTVSMSAPPADNPVPEEWLSGAMQALHERFPNDSVELTLRKSLGNEPEWRIKCLDCPGKLYKPGPGKTMDNFEIHLKNRTHRQRVNERVVGTSTS